MTRPLTRIEIGVLALEGVGLTIGLDSGEKRMYSRIGTRTDEVRGFSVPRLWTAGEERWLFAGFE
jgi:hypothetical protein